MGSSRDSGGSAKLSPLSLTAVFVLAALSAVAFGSCGDDDEPTVPAGAVAVIEHVPPGRGEITKAEVEHQVDLDGIGEENESLGGLVGGGAEGELGKNAAIQKLITRRWIEGEAEELDITVSDREIAKEIRLGEVADRLGGKHGEKPYGPATAFPARADLEEVIRENTLEEKIQLETKDESFRPLEFQPEFIRKWQARTYCAPEFMSGYCANSPTAEE